MSNRRVWTSVSTDPIAIREFVAAAQAAAPPQPLPRSLWWALSPADAGVGLFVAAGCLLEAMERALEHLNPGDGRRFLAQVYRELVSDAPVGAGAERPDVWRVSGSVR